MVCSVNCIGKTFLNNQIHVFNHVQSDLPDEISLFKRNFSITAIMESDLVPIVIVTIAIFLLFQPCWLK